MKIRLLIIDYECITLVVLHRLHEQHINSPPHARLPKTPLDSPRLPETPQCDNDNGKIYYYQMINISIISIVYYSLE